MSDALYLSTDNECVAQLSLCLSHPRKLEKNWRHHKIV